MGLVPLEISNAVGVKELMPLLGFSPGVGEIVLNGRKNDLQGSSPFLEQHA